MRQEIKIPQMMSVDVKQRTFGNNACNDQAVISGLNYDEEIETTHCKETKRGCYFTYTPNWDRYHNSQYLAYACLLRTVGADSSRSSRSHRRLEQKMVRKRLWR